MRMWTWLGTGLTAAALAVALAGCGGEESTSENAGGGGGSSGGEAGASGAGAGGETTEDAGTDVATLDHFSFFVTSLSALQQLSGSQAGFGGNLTFGETGAGAGLRGADKICAAIAERSMPGSSQKQWRAFLSVTADENGQQVNAIDRIGEGPWYDRRGRLLAPTKAELLSDRPLNGDATIANDFPNEDGVLNHRPDPTQPEVDNHDMLTGSNAQGRLYGATATCNDWTSATGSTSEGRPRVGHSWPRSGVGGGFDGGLPGFDGGPPGFDGGPPGFDGGPPGFDGGPPGFDGGPPGFDGGPPGFDGGPGDGGFDSMENWMSALDESGCAPGVNLIETGGPLPGANTVGSGGGYGGFYCFALVP